MNNEMYCKMINNEKDSPKVKKIVKDNFERFLQRFLDGVGFSVLDLKPEDEDNLDVDKEEDKLSFDLEMVKISQEGGLDA